MAQSNGSRSASNPVNFYQFLSLETVNPNKEKTLGLAFRLFREASMRAAPMDAGANGY